MRNGRGHYRETDGTNKESSMIHGVINIQKEKGYTSHDVVAKLRGIVGQKKIGHTGTLDPDATGVLPVCFGKATKLCDMLTDKNKTYETVLLLGKVTDTQDLSGTVLEEHETNSYTEEEVRKAILSFEGEYRQIPPMYSALKVNGKKLYELAREGIEVERKARLVNIFEIQILEIQLPRIRMKVSCSKGTYIRTLCHDIGAKLGCGACMEELIRTKVSRFTIEDSVTLSEVQQLKEEGRLAEILVPIDEMFSELEAVTLQESFLPLVYNGNVFFPKHLKKHVVLADGKKVRVYDNKGRFLAIYRFEKENDLFKLEKMFFDRNEQVNYVTGIETYQDERPCAITLGKFDGLHLGHECLISRVAEHRKQDGVIGVVVAFDMRPLFEKQKKPYQILLTNREKADLLKEKVDYFVDCPFDESIASMEAETFIRKILVERFHAKYVVVGTDFRFGYRKRGDCHMLQTFGEIYGFQVEVIEKMCYQGREISSTYIKELLTTHQKELADKLLGYEYKKSFDIDRKI